MKCRVGLPRILYLVILAYSLFFVPFAQAQFSQQGQKLVGAGAIGPEGAQQGWSVSLSSDGNTAIVGGPTDNSDAGAAWVYMRSAAGTWTQQGPKLVGTGAVGPTKAMQGFSVAVSGDGNTAIVGGPTDANAAGAAWVYTRSGGVWAQQGPKLVGSGVDFDHTARFGFSVALSGDGNTAIIGGPGDNNVGAEGRGDGAAWVYTRSRGGVWIQQGPKLVGAGAVGPFPISFSGAAQGWSVSLSSDGNTALVGGPADNSGSGAIWAYARSAGVWSQQGAKLVGMDAAGPFETANFPSGFNGAAQGWSVSLSGDGNTAIVGGPSDYIGSGAAWVYTRSSSVWTQQGPKLVGAGAVGPAFPGGPIAWQGWSVSLSGDGYTALVGGPADNSDFGAAWVYTRSTGVWTQQGLKLVGTGPAQGGWSVSLSGDGNTAIVGGRSDDYVANGFVGAGAAWVYAKPVATPVFAGTPGEPSCRGKSVSALARQFGGLKAAAEGLKFRSVRGLQNAIRVFCKNGRAHEDKRENSGDDDFR